jgi:cytochrome P450
LCAFIFFIDWARKGISPAFSKINLDKRLPEIRQKMAQFSAILDQHIDGNKPLIDFPSWMVKLTIDFISTSMFDNDFKTIENDSSLIESDGKVYLTNLPITIKVSYYLHM